MGRAKYTPEARNAIMAAFVSATKEVIDEDGIEAASIRGVSTRAGYSSATLYLYFEDMNELIAMSFVSYLTEYVNDIIETTPVKESPEDTYVRTWRLFCKHAFKHPAAFLNLFYGPQADNVNSIAAKYYELFPDELERASGRMLDMLSRGSLLERNGILIEDLAPSIGLTAQEVKLANDLTVAYLYAFLRNAMKLEPTDAEMDSWIDEFMDGALFVLRGKVEQ